MSDTRGPGRQQRRPRHHTQDAQPPRGRWRRITGRVTWAVAGLAMAGLVVRLVVGDPELEAAVELTADEVDQARTAAGCEVVATEPAGDSTHLSPDVTAADVDTGTVQPPTGAAHYRGTNFLVEEGIDRQLDVLSVGHNLEHGAVVAWYDPASIGGATLDQMQDWSGLLNNSGFTNQPAGAGIFVAPFDDPGISSGAAIALRAWGLGVDCDSWNETAANSFVVEAYGNRDVAPEGVPYPNDTLSYSDPPPTSFRQATAN